MSPMILPVIAKNAELSDGRVSRRGLLMAGMALAASVLVAAALINPAAAQVATEVKPNVVFILADTSVMGTLIRALNPPLRLPDLDYPFHVRSSPSPVRPNLFNREKNNLSIVFAGQRVGIKQVSDLIWLVSFMDYDLGYFDHETCRLEPIENPFGPKVLPMSQTRTERPAASDSPQPQLRKINVPATPKEAEKAHGGASGRPGRRSARPLLAHAPI